MSIDTYLRRLASAGISPEQIPGKSDSELLMVRGVGRTGLRLVRERYGKSPKGDEPLEDQVYEALRPVLCVLRGVGTKDVRRVSKAVVAFFS